MSGQGETGQASSFTDLMASLMVIFVLLLVAYVNNAGTKNQTIKDQLLVRLREKLATAGLSAEMREDEKDRNAIVVVIADSLLFDRGSKEVRPSGRRALQDLMPLVSAVLCESGMRRNVQTVVVEGHTDTTWASSGEVGLETARDLNLELSQGRSMEVVKASLSSVADTSGRACFRALLSASGRGQEEPLPAVRGDDARQRRVVFKIRVATNVAEGLRSELGSGPPAKSGAAK